MVRQAALAVCILLAGSARAQEDEAELSKSLVPPAWEIAPEVSHFRYREPGMMKDQGTFYGVVGSYTRRHQRQSSPTQPFAESNDTTSWTTFKIEGRFSFGQVDYDGAYMDGTPLAMSGADDFLMDVRLMYGREWQPASFFDAFYVGVGYRYLNDDSSSHPAGYERQSNYVYVPLGSRVDRTLKDGWTVGLTGELDVLLVGRQISDLSDVDPALPDVGNWQWPGFGIRSSIAFRHRGGSHDLAVAPFIRYWWIAESDTSQGYFEPENNTFEYGLSFIARF